MKKVSAVLVLLLALTLSLFALTACAGTGEYNFELPEKIIIGFDPAFPPMGFHDAATDRDVGFDLDVADAVFEKLGIEYEFKSIEWETKEEELKGGRCDCLWNGYTMTDDRMLQIDFSIPYLKNTQVAMVKYDSPYQTIADLASTDDAHKLLYQDGGSALDAINASELLKNNKLLGYKDYSICYENLKSDRGIAIIIDKVVADYQILLNPNTYRVIPETLASELYAVGFRREDVALRIKFNTALLEVAEEGKLLEIAKKWGIQDLLLFGK